MQRLTNRFKYGVQWGVLTLLIVVHLVTFVAAPLYPSHEGFIALIWTYFVTGLGVTLGYHRRLTHRAFLAPRWMDRLLAVLGMLAGEGPPIFWVAHHRKHHAFSDRGDDSHSPRVGFWWAHCLWLLPRQKEPERVFYARWASDLSKDRFYLFLESTYLYWHIMVGGVLFYVGQQLGGWTLGMSLLVYGLFVRMVLVLHTTWVVNSVCHRWGYRNYTTDDDSRNNVLVGLAALGEGWHNNHHHIQTAANHGQRWWEIDVSFLVILLLAACSWPLKKIGAGNLRLVHGLKVYTRAAGMSLWFP